MKISIRLKIVILSLITFAIVATIGWLSYKSRLNLVESEEWIGHTNQIINQSNNILSLAKDIETAARGFVITSDSAFLEPPRPCWCSSPTCTSIFFTPPVSFSILHLLFFSVHLGQCVCW